MSKLSSEWLLQASIIYTIQNQSTKENYTVTQMSQILFQNNCKEWTYNKTFYDQIKKTIWNKKCGRAGGLLEKLAAQKANLEWQDTQY